MHEQVPNVGENLGDPIRRAFRFEVLRARNAHGAVSREEAWGPLLSTGEQLFYTVAKAFEHAHQAIVRCKGVGGADWRIVFGMPIIDLEYDRDPALPLPEAIINAKTLIELVLVSRLPRMGEGPPDPDSIMREWPALKAELWAVTGLYPANEGSTLPGVTGETVTNGIIDGRIRMGLADSWLPTDIA